MQSRIKPGFLKDNRNVVILAVLLGAFLAALDVTIAGTSMPTIIGRLGGMNLFCTFRIVLAAALFGLIFSFWLPKNFHEGVS